MIDERELFERAGDRVAPPEHVMDNLIRRRRRQQRGRRIGSAIVAIVITVAATGALLEIFDRAGLRQPAAPSTTPEVAWIRTTTHTRSSVVVADPTGVYVASELPHSAGQLRKLDPAGAELWRLDLDSRPVSMAVDPTGTYLAVSGPDRLMKVSPDGEVLWQRRSRTYAVASGGSGIYATSYPGVITYYAGSGERVWSVRTAGHIGGDLTYPGGSGFLVADASGVYASVFVDLPNRVGFGGRLELRVLKIGVDGTEEWSHRTGRGWGKGKPRQRIAIDDSGLYVLRSVTRTASGCHGPTDRYVDGVRVCGFSFDPSGRKVAVEASAPTYWYMGGVATSDQGPMTFLASGEGLEIGQFDRTFHRLWTSTVTLDLHGNIFVTSATFQGGALYAVGGYGGAAGMRFLVKIVADAWTEP